MRTNRRDLLIGAATLAAANAVSGPSQAQVPSAATSDGGLMASASYAPARTWPELKAEVQARTDRQVYPLTGMRSEDVRVILDRITSLDRDEWGESWSQMAQDWIAKGDALATHDPKAAGDAYIMAWRYASFGGWPIAISPKKQASYDLSVKAFIKYGELQDPKIERIQIPFEGSTFPVYLQLPKSGNPVPVIISIGGLDSYKEYVAERYGPVYMKRSFGYVAVDGPHTGEATVRADQHGDRIYSAVIDYLLSRSDVDRSRIGVQGVSNGGYWSTRTAFTEASRLRFAVNWAGPLDQAWSRDSMRRAISSREYLFDLAQAFMSVYGYDTPEALIAGSHKMSIVELGIVDHPTPAMLIVNGLKDTLVPAADTLLLLQHGMAKSAWINPNGIHLARTPDWPDERIMREVIMPWIETAAASTNS